MSARVPKQSRFMRRRDVCSELGITRHTLAGIEQRDGRFPAFIEVAPGVAVIERKAFERWWRLKQLEAQKSTALHGDAQSG